MYRTGLVGIGLPAALKGVKAGAAEHGKTPDSAPQAAAAIDDRHPVFLDYTQARLDAAYSQLHWVDLSIEQIVSRSTRLSEVARRRFDQQTFAYGDDPAEKLDVFLCEQHNAPIHVFLHGGTWRKLSKDQNAFPALSFVPSGGHYVAVNFSNIPEVRLPDMVDQVRRAVAWVHANAARFGGDADRIYVSGHSSGGHLAAAVLTTDWQRYASTSAVVRGGLCISGMYDLYPVQQSFRGDYLNLSANEIEALSPGRHLDWVRCPITVAHGSAETPEFQRQARHFAAELQTGDAERGHRFFAARGLNHFDIWFSLADPESAVGRLALSQMGLGDRPESASG